MNFLIFFTNLILCQFEEETSKDAVYKLHPHSIEPPYVDSFGMPFFDFGEDTVINTFSQVRLTPDLSSKSGYLWSKKVLPFNSWQIETDFHINGKLSHISGDGLAFWTTVDRMKPGHVFGNQDFFKGFALIIDTYANTNHDESFPYIQGIVNDGTKHYNIDNDGKDVESAGCSADIKHTTKPAAILITYVKGSVIEVKFKTNREEKEWIHCFTINGITLPDNLYLGFTAHTGQLHDNHDILKVTTRSSNKKDFVYNAQPQKTNKSYSGASVGSFLFKMVLLVAVVFIIYYGYKAMQEKNNKRF